MFEGQKDNFETIDLNKLYLFFDKFAKIYFNYNNLLYLLIDYNIFTLLEIKIDNITFELNIKDLFNNKDINPKKYLIFDTKLETLYYYHSLGCFTVYLSHLVKMDLKSDEEKKYIDDFNDNNLMVINNKGIFFDFSLTFMIQCINYIHYINNYEKELKHLEGNTLLEKIKNKTGCYIVMLIYRFFFKKKEIKRANIFIGNDKILYVTYVGDYKKNCYDYLNTLYLNNKSQKPDGFIIKLSSNICLKDYPQLIEDLIKIRKEHPEIFFSNNVDNTKIYLNRGLQINMINNFAKEFNSDKLFLPNSIEESYLKIENFQKFQNFVIKNELNYPLMLKFSGDKKKYDHLIINIVCEEGLKNFFEYFKTYTSKDNKDKIKIVVQKFVNHGGYVIKLYRINAKSYFYYRPSFPDSKIEFVNRFEEYKRGFLELTTPELITKKYRDFWEKVNGVNENYKGLVDEEYLSRIGENFEKFSGDSLVGLDFVFDIEKGIYYLIDVNQFPGYKELINEMNEIMSEHMTLGIKKIKEKK
jgi:inositol-1,3,4-trisphosphate 5/6-kinase/inositol-tetrakisphosphate 1-kinase